MRGMAWNSALGISMLLKAWYIVMDGLNGMVIRQKFNFW